MLILFISEGESINYNPIFSVCSERERKREEGREGGRGRDLENINISN